MTTTHETKELSMELRKAPTLLYVVYWPKEGVLKVGRATHMGRVRKHTNTGGQVLALIRNRSSLDETAALVRLARAWPLAFTRWKDARHILGANGSGYSECFRVPPVATRDAVNLVLRAVARG